MRVLHRLSGFIALLFLATLPIVGPLNVSKAQTVDPCPAPVSSDPVSTHGIHITELLVNPVGLDTAGEFIELWNPEPTPALLTGWTLEDAKAKTFSLAGVTIPAESFVALPYSQTHLTLVNTGGTISLKDASGAVRSVAVYGGDGGEGQSFARNAAGTFTWVDTPTPGSANVFASAEPEPTPEPTPVDPTVPDPTPVEPAPTDPDATTPPPSTEPPTDIAEPAPCDCETTTLAASDDDALISELRDLPDGTKVALQGVVSLATGRIGTTIFAIQAPDGSSGTYVRMYGTERPELQVGDAVAVTGKVARANGSMRITTGKNGVVPSGAAPGIDASPMDLADLADILDGVTVSVEGELSESGKGWMLLSDASGKAELRVAFEQSRTFTDIPQHSVISVTGVLHFVSGKPELLADDATMHSTPPPQETPTAATGSGQVVGTESPASSPVVGGALALSPIVASLGVLGWKRWKGMPVGLS